MVVKILREGTGGDLMSIPEERSRNGICTVYLTGQIFNPTLPLTGVKIQKVEKGI